MVLSIGVTQNIAAYWMYMAGINGFFDGADLGLAVSRLGYRDYCEGPPYFKHWHSSI